MISVFLQKSFIIISSECVLRNFDDKYSSNHILRKVWINWKPWFPVNSLASKRKGRQIFWWLPVGIALGALWNFLTSMLSWDHFHCFRPLHSPTFTVSGLLPLLAKSEMSGLLRSPWVPTPSSTSQLPDACSQLSGFLACASCQQHCLVCLFCLVA